MQLQVRRGALVSVLAITVAAGAAVPAVAGAADGARLSTTSQQAITSSRSLVVTVSAPKRVTATLTATAGGKAIAKKQSLRFAKNGSHRVAVPLSSTGLKAIRSCQATTVKLSLKVGKKTTSRSAAITRDSMTCDPLKPVTIPGPTVVVPGPTVTVPGETVTTPGPTVTVPGETVTTPGPTVTVPGETVTTPGPTVTVPGETVTVTVTTPTPPPTPQPGPEVDVSNADHCDFLTADCLAPFPNDYFTTTDPDTVTGRRVDIPLAAMPANANDVHMDPTDINRGDGFSAGAVIQVHIPGFDTAAAYAATNPVPVTDVDRSFDPNQQIVLIDARTGERQLIWSELDSNAPTPAQTDLEIHPATQLKEGHRYIVALRNLKNAGGDIIPAGDAFRIYRDGLTSDQSVVNDRRDHMESILDKLDRSGIERDDLYLAWDFTTASAQSVTSRMLSIRDQAFAGLGDHDLADLSVQGRAPDWTFTDETTYSSTPGDSNYNQYWGRRIRGTVEVPCFLTTPDCQPTGVFDLDDDGNPIQHGTTDAPFSCNIPHSVVDGPSGTKARPTMYGHGLFGTAGQTDGGRRGQQATAAGGPLMMCGTDFKGMAGDDEEVAAGLIMPDMSHFNMMADRMQQGLLNFLFLGRLMIHPDGFAADAHFRATKNGSSESLIDTRALFYTGVSEGGILGGALTAVAPDFTRAALAVPGMNYSVLLPRSTDFNQFKPYLNGSALGGGYPDESDQVLVLSLAQMLWDRGEPNGYVHHMTDDPLPNTPRHKVLFSGAFADHQVSNVTLATEARTLGASVRAPLFDPGRSPDVTPFYGLPEISSWPFTGSASVVMTDIGPLRPGLTEDSWLGTNRAPNTNTPPVSFDEDTGEANDGIDPHEFGGQEQNAADQIAQFLQIGGNVVDTCGVDPCRAAGWTGP